MQPSAGRDGAVCRDGYSKNVDRPRRGTSPPSGRQRKAWSVTARTASQPVVEPAAESVGKKHFSVELCGTLCLCGEIAHENIHHGGTEIAQRTTEMNFSDRLRSGRQLSSNEPLIMVNPVCSQELNELIPKRNPQALRCHRRFSNAATPWQDRLTSNHKTQGAKPLTSRASHGPASRLSISCCRTSLSAHPFLKPLKININHRRQIQRQHL
jgi:hypothetical protein